MDLADSPGVVESVAEQRLGLIAVRAQRPSRVSEQVSARTFTALLPGVNWAVAVLTTAAMPAAGIAVGALGALGGLRRRAA